MAEYQQKTTQDRKRRLSHSVNHRAWPTPPTDPEHEFSRQEMEAQSADKDQLSIQLPPLEACTRNLENRLSIQSPPATPSQQTWTAKLPPIQSPPDSPTHTSLPSLGDRELFSGPGENSHTPLFADQSSPTTRNDSLSPRDAVPKPVEPVVDGMLRVHPQFKNADREFFRNYHKVCYDELMRIPGWRPRQSPPSSQDASVGRRTTALADRSSNRVTKPRERSAAVKSAQSAPKVQKLQKASPAPRPPRAPVKPRERSSASVEPQARKRAPPSKPIVSDNWLQIPDYSPSTSTLDDASLRLRVHWKGVPNDLSHDSEISHLHPQEVEIAQELKLPASQYLSNKRRIFEARLKSIREQKNFTKTAAQQACNIDVNKTSQLYEAYEKVGWFDESHFKRWLV